MELHVIIVVTMLFLRKHITDARPSSLYAVLCDAGSSSTKLRIYTWPERSSTSSLLNMTMSYYEKFKPGLSNVDDDNLPSYLDQLIASAKTHVPSYLHSKTRIYLFATAGLRVLSEPRAIWIMDSVRSFMSNNSINPFLYSDRGIRILSGEEEGVFAWITANYHNQFFGSKRPNSQAVGVLEMGGGSTQITFLPDGPLLANMFSLRIAGEIYSLYSHSYLYYGQDYMQIRVQNYLITNSPSSSELFNPCMLKNDNKTYTTEDGRAVLFRGSSDPSLCLTIINTYLPSAQDYMCYPKPCAIGTTYQPSIGSDIFYAIAAFTYSVQTLGATDSMGRLDIVKLNDTANLYCRKTLSEAMSEFSIELEYASPYCMMALYIPSLLTSAYGFETDTQKIVITTKINGHSVDWSLGSVLYETELTEKDYPCSDISGATKSLSRILNIVLLLIVYGVFTVNK